MVDRSQVARSKEIQRRTGRTFHVATRFLPRRVRHATYVLYGFFRIADEVVDSAVTAPPDVQRERLERLRAEALGRTNTDNPVLSAFAELRAEHDVAAADVDAFVDAMLADIDTDRYDTYDDLAAYMDGSASAVGRMMTDVMLSDPPEHVRSRATALGQAFQLTNFVRDVREDVVERDRVYLPRATMERYGADVADVEDLTVTPAVREAIRHELERAEDLYREGVAGIPYLPVDCQFPVLLAAVLYAEHHRLVRRRDYDTVSATPSLSTSRTLSLALRTRWRWFRNPDPEAVFEAVSAVEPVGSAPHCAGPSRRVAVRLSMRLRELLLR